MKRLFIDMDGVLCNYQKAYINAKKQFPNQPYPQARYGFFLQLEPLPDAIHAFKTLQTHFETFILTAPSYHNPLSYTEKRLWVEHHLGLETTKNLILCRQKELLKGDFLIDDSPFPDFEGAWLHFGSARFPDWQALLQYLIPLAS